MKRFIITEEEKRHIIGLYKQSLNEIITDIDPGSGLPEVPNKQLPHMVLDPYLTGRVTAQLGSAKKWWKDWLSNINTLAKFLKLNKFDTIEKMKEGEKIYDKYFYIIDKTVLSFYNPDHMQSQELFAELGITEKDEIFHLYRADAFVLDYKPRTIFVNLKSTKYMTDKEILRTLIHEMQHLLYFVKPLSGEAVSQFKTSDDCFNKNLAVYNNKQLDYGERVKTLLLKNKNTLAKDFSIDAELFVSKIYRIIYSAYNGGWEKAYLLDDSEISSRISETREYFGVTPEKGLTKQNFIDYIINAEENGKIDQSVDFVLAQWVMKEFPPLDEFVKGINSLVKTDPTKQKTSPLDSPYQPKKYYV